LPLYAGAAVLGDGRVVLILDVHGLARAVDADGEAAEEADAGADARRDLQSYLVVRRGDGGRVAVPLGQVARLEQIPRGSVEHADGREVVQYRGRILPLVRLAGGGHAADGPMQVVVHRAGGSDGVGFVVDEIVDIVQESADVLLRVDGPGLVGSAVIQQRVTDLLDFEKLLRAVDPGLAAARQD
jgi:two-component system chemotaxis sensor kinase CheA